MLLYENTARFVFQASEQTSSKNNSSSAQKITQEGPDWVQGLSARKRRWSTSFIDFSGHTPHLDFNLLIETSQLFLIAHKWVTNEWKNWNEANGFHKHH